MKRLINISCVLFIMTIIVSTTVFSSEGTFSSFDDVYEYLREGNDKYGYIIGKFPMTHICDPAIAVPIIADKGLDVNQHAKFVSKMKLVRLDKKRTYNFEIKPITGSYTAYYSDQKLVQNSNDPYYVQIVPSGNYELTKLTSNLSLYVPNYSTFKSQILDVPVSKLINKEISFSVKPKQIIYIGDYNITFITYISLYEQTKLYPFRVINIELEDGFESFKTAFINGADEKTKEEINEYEFVSLLQL